MWLPKEPHFTIRQRSRAEFADGSRQIKSNHFLPGRVPGRKYFSGRKSSAAALCRTQPPKAALSVELCELCAYGAQGVRAADCKKLAESPEGGYCEIVYRHLKSAKTLPPQKCGSVF